MIYALLHLLDLYLLLLLLCFCFDWTLNRIVIIGISFHFHYAYDLLQTGHPMAREGDGEGMSLSDYMHR